MAGDDVVPIYKSTVKDTNKKPKKPKKQREKKAVSATSVKKYVCIAVISLCALFFLMLILPSNFLKTFLLGSFGLFIYPLCVVGVILGVAGLTGNKYVVDKKYVTYLSIILFLVLMVFHLVLTMKYPTDSFSAYISKSYHSGMTAGGVVLGLLVYPIQSVLTRVGAYVFISIGLAIFVALLLDYIVVKKYNGEQAPSRFDFGQMTQVRQSVDVPITLDHKIEQDKKELAKHKLGIITSESEIISTNMPINNIYEKVTDSRPVSRKEYILTPPEIVMPSERQPAPYKAPTNLNKTPINLNDTLASKPSADDSSDSDGIVYQGEVDEVPFEPSEPDILSEIQSNTQPETVVADNDDIDIDSADIDIDTLPEVALPEENTVVEESTEEPIDFKKDIPSDDLNIFVSAQSTAKLGDTTEKSEHQTISIDKGIELQTDKVFTKEFKPMAPPPSITPTVVQGNDKPTVIKPYVKPPVELLHEMDNDDSENEEYCLENIDKLEKVLEDFKVPAKVINFTIGPAVTRYELSMPQGISVKKIQMYSDDIALALASNGAIRIEAPIPGKNAVGIEVPNSKISAVSLRSLMDSKQYQERGNPMSFVLGKDINGDIQFCNLDKMPHLLVAGSTGSGKSVCLNTLIISMIGKSSPQDLRLILIDPKMVEFSIYENLPHLLTPNIITTREQAINSLNWAVAEMERRYKLLTQNHVVNIREYNNLPFVKADPLKKIPYIVIIVDELADLMMEAKKDIEDKIMRLAQKARAAGIHLVLATQRPSVDVITGTIKANLPSRITFALTNFTDSKTVIDQGGAEKLLGRGDMLFKPLDAPEPKRVQGAYVSSEEVASIVDYIKEHNSTCFDAETEKSITAPQTANNFGGGRVENLDPIFKDVLRFFIQTNQASTTWIQRRFNVGFSRAGRIMDAMTDMGFISQPEGTKPRQILITMEEFNEKFGE